jgi:hypothetical protein
MTSATTPTRTPNKLQAKDEGLFGGFEDMKIRIVVMTLTRWQSPRPVVARADYYTVVPHHTPSR